MWRIVLHMLSTGSLAAFSAALSPTAVVPPGGSGSRVAATQIGSAWRAAPASGTAQPATPPVLKPGQVLPRGSLLNLSV